MQSLRLFFPLWSMTTVIGQNPTAQKLETKKLHQWGAQYLLPHIATKKYRKFPFKITIKYFIYSDMEITSLLILSSYITNAYGLLPMQSDDYRVVPKVEILTQKALTRDAEGCEIIIESLHKSKHLQPKPLLS